MLDLPKLPINLEVAHGVIAELLVEVFVVILVEAQNIKDVRVEEAAPLLKVNCSSTNFPCIDCDMPALAATW